VLQLAAIEGHAAGRAVTEDDIKQQLVDLPAPVVAMPVHAALSVKPELLPFTLAVTSAGKSTLPAGNGRHALGLSSPSSGYTTPVSRSHSSWTATSSMDEDCEVGGSLQCLLCQFCAICKILNA